MEDPPHRHHPAPETSRSQLFVASLEKGLRVLRAFGGTQRSLSLTELAGRTGLDRSAVQRFSHTLYVLGYLRKDGNTRRYSLAPRTLELGLAYLRLDEVVERATPFLAECNQRCEETVNLTELDGAEVVYVARFPSRHAVSVDVLLGTRLPAYCTAPGRAILSQLPEQKALAIVRASRRTRFTPHTATAMATIMQHIARARRDGYSVANQECFEGDLSVAAPVFNLSGEVVAAVNIAVPLARWTPRALAEKLVPEVVGTARAVSRALGNTQRSAVP